MLVSERVLMAVVGRVVAGYYSSSPATVPVLSQIMVCRS